MMKIKHYTKFIEGVRKDDLSHLNDGLSANKKNEGRWPEDEDYDFEDDSTKDYGDYDDWYDESDFDKLGTSSNPKFDKSRDDWDYEGDEEDDSDDRENLHSLLRQMFRSSGIKDVRVTSVKHKEIIIECHLPIKTDLKTIISALDVAHKLKRDILSQYECDFDVWQAVGKGVITFEFYLTDGEEEDSVPF
ncbi:hypothetical protein EBU95_18955 [bacterium]|nr:hypothetical protein [bacterium]